MKILLCLLATCAFGGAAVAAPVSSVQREALFRAVGNKLKVPSSAQFRKIELVDREGSTKLGVGLYCGEVNAQGQSRTHTGYMPFMALVKDDHVSMINVAHNAATMAVVRERCRRGRGK